MPARWLFGPGSASTIRARIQWLVVVCTVPLFLLAVLWLVLSYRSGRDAVLQTNLQAARTLVSLPQGARAALLCPLSVVRRTLMIACPQLCGWATACAPPCSPHPTSAWRARRTW